MVIKEYTWMKRTTAQENFGELHVTIRYGFISYLLWERARITEGTCSGKVTCETRESLQCREWQWSDASADADEI